jgi:hypothetical protein
MPFATDSSVADVVRAHSIRCSRVTFLTPVARPLDDHFRSELGFTLEEDLDGLAGALHDVTRECCNQVASEPAPA